MLTRRHSINRARNRLATLQARGAKKRSVKAAERKLEAAKATFARGGAPNPRDPADDRGIGWTSSLTLRAAKVQDDGKDTDRLEKAAAKRQRKSALRDLAVVNVHGGQLVARDALRGAEYNDVSTR